jgi:integral membrane protein (TIGR01906 family)
MQSMPAPVALICRVLLTVLIPVVLVLTNVRLLMTHIFPEVEYRLPGFPPDSYGFTLEDRLKWSKISVDFLLNDAGIEFLASLRFPDGQLAPEPSRKYYLDNDFNRFYNDRELRHMEDVKIVTRNALRVWVLSGVAALMCVAALYYFREMTTLRAGLLSGAGLTIALLLGIVLFVFAAFDILFVQFHQVFFQAGTWTFEWSDSLIRLFPQRFWQDTFLFIGGASVLEAGLIAAIAWWWVK